MGTGFLFGDDEMFWIRYWLWLHSLVNILKTKYIH